MSRIFALALLAIAAACSQPDIYTSESAATSDRLTSPPAAETGLPTVSDAADFVEDAEQQLEEIGEYRARVSWVQENFITYDTNWLATRALSDYTELRVDLANGTKRFIGMDLPYDLDRKINILRQGLTIPAPSNPEATRELAALQNRLESTYSTGKGLYRGESVPLVELEDKMRTVRSESELLEMWTSWREVSPQMRSDYARMVDIANAGARELGYDDVGHMWRSGYDMSPDDFAALTDRLWEQIKPLYDDLHCYVREQLAETYNSELVKPGEPIPAHLLGNMWAQDWANVYDLVAPPSSGAGFDLTTLLVDADYDVMDIFRTADDFFVSLGFEPHPPSFWERSLFVKPSDREVVCHASAWQLDGKEDLRVKMCTKVNGDDFKTVHHELGHTIYDRAYMNRSVLYRSGANDGFHEAIGDMVALSVTPEYLNEIGLLDQVPDASSDLGLLMQRALDGVSFFPFGLMVDKWRWKVFSGELTPDTYNEGWWDLRTRYQGVAAPVAREARHFDPGAKYHIPNSVPYTRYFLAGILQYQFHRAACEMAGWTGPLHRCSVYGNKEVGRRFRDMLAMGSSRPWPEALEAFTGSRNMDASAVTEYYAPLHQWLKEQNAGKTCGW